MDKFTAGLHQGMSAILQRRKSRDSGESSDSPTAYERLPEMAVNFEVEEEQVMKGLELVYQDRLNEADEYFETLKAGHARFSLHHAEVAAFVAMMSFEPEDVEFATTLLNETLSLADQQARRWRTHSNIKKVEEAVGAVKNWALTTAATALSKVAGPVGAQVSAKLMPVESPNLPFDDDDDDGKTSSREEATYNHRARRLHLWALLIQGECHLMTSFLQVVVAGESWTAMVKVGYNVKRCWSIYQHCQKKLAQLQKEWVSFGGTLIGTGPLRGSLIAESDSDDDSNQPDLSFYMADALTATGPSTSTARRSQNYDPELSAPEGEMEYQGVRAAAGNLEKLEENLKEDQELASLRIGIQFGIGAFNLLVSLIPTNYQKAIELMAVPGDRNHGLSLLRKVSGLHHCRAPLAAIVLLNYFTVLMGLLPFSQENAVGARNVLNMLPLAWKESSVFRTMQARLAAYESQLQQATKLIVSCLRNLGESNDRSGGGIPMKRLVNMMVDENGWYLLLQGDFVQAYERFGSLYKDTTWLKPYYAWLMAACCFDAGGRYQHDASKLMRDLPGMISSKKSSPTPLEQMGARYANEFISTGQVPLFPALEILALYNGFQHMDKATLKRHLDRIGDALMNQSPKDGSDFQQAFSGAEPGPSYSSQSGGPPSYDQVMSKETLGEVVGGHRRIPFQSKSKAPANDPKDESDLSDGGSKFKHTWSKNSEVLCRYLIALCQRSLGDLKQAESNFRYVVSQADVTPGNVVSYACFEWGSMLLNSEVTSPEGLNLLEKSLNFPSHEFQTRLKFIVNERLRMFRRACENDLSSQASTTSALNLRRVSELLRTVPLQQKNIDDNEELL